MWKLLRTSLHDVCATFGFGFAFASGICGAKLGASLQILPCTGYCSFRHFTTILIRCLHSFYKTFINKHFWMPKMLSCLHTFCEACIATFARKTLLCLHTFCNACFGNRFVLWFCWIMRLDMVRHVEFIGFCQCQDWYSLRVECLPYGGKYLSNSWGSKPCGLVLPAAVVA